MLIPYFHIYADGDWELPATEFFDHLPQLGAHVRVGVVGSPENLISVRHWLSRPGRSHDATIVAYSPDGWEQTTLEFLHAESTTTDLPFLYTHTKGAADPSDLNVAWRRSMLRHVVAPCRSHLHLLPDYAIIGTRWLRSHPTGVGFFAGNFWIATAAHLRGLPPLEYRDRYQAETWIGQGNPTHLDLCPGWPATFNLGE